MLPRYTDMVIRHPRLVLTLALLATALAAAGMAFVTFRADERVFFAEDNPRLKRLEAFEARYGSDDNVVVVVHSTQGTLYQRRHLKAVAEMTKELGNVPYAKRVDSPTNFQMVTGDDAGMRVGHLWRLGDPVEPAELRKRAERMPLLMNRLLAEDGRTGLIAVSLNIPAAKKNAAAFDVMSFMRERIPEYRSRYSDLELHITGSAALDAAFVRASIWDSTTLIPAMYGLFLVFLALLLQAVVPVMAAFITVSGAIAAAIGLGAAMGMPLTSVSVSAPFVISIIALCGVVHLVFAVAAQRRAGDEQKAAVRNGMQRTAWPIFLTSATTACGFFSLGFAEVPPFAHLGLFAGMGTVIAWLLTMTLVPALLAQFSWRPRGPLTHMQRVSGRIGAWAGRRPAAAVALTLVPAVGAAAFITHNELDDRYVHYFGESFAFRQATDALHQYLGGFYKLEYNLPAGDTGAISEPAYIRAVDRFAKWLREQPEVTHVESHADRIKMIHRAVRGGEAESYAVPDNRGVAAQLLALYEMQLPIGRNLSEDVATDKSATRLTARLTDVSTAEILDLKRRAAKWIETNTPRLAKGKKATGTAVMFAHIGMRNIESMFTGTAVAFGLIAGLLFIAFRSLTTTAIAMVANTMPALSALGAWGLLVGEVGMAVATIVATTLGLVVDDTIHLVYGIRRHLTTRDNLPAVMGDALAEVTPGISTTTLCIVGGFFVLSLSAFQINAWIGLMTAVVALIAFFFDLLFIPGTIALLHYRRRRESAHANTQDRSVHHAT